jgi:hypothetical protein
MAEAGPRGRTGSRGASLKVYRPADRTEIPEAQASSKALFSEIGPRPFSPVTRE